MNSIKNISLTIFSLMMGLNYIHSADISLEELKIIGVTEYGVMQNGIENQGAGKPQILRDNVLDQFSGFLQAEAHIDEGFRLLLSIGGTFQFAKPENDGVNFESSQRRSLFMEPGVAKGIYSWGDPEGMAMSLHFGLFPYKYNPDAYNLGEYLFRTTPYPQTITTGNRLIINNRVLNNQNYGLNYDLIGINPAGAQLQGWGFNLKGYGLNLDFIVATETTLPPFSDFSVASVASYSIADGLIELGAGVNFKGLIPVDKNRSEVPRLSNAVFEIPNPDSTAVLGSKILVSGNPAYYDLQVKTLNAKKTVLDSANAQELLAIKNALPVWGDFSSVVEDKLTLSQRKDSIQSYLDTTNGFLIPYGGIILMGRVSIDIKKLFGESSLFKPQDLRLFGEAALLGFKDYDVFYESKKERLALMAGLTLPTFGVLDLLAIQMESFNSPYMNSHRNIGDLRGAIPHYPIYDQDVGFLEATSEDNFYWSVLLQKQFIKGVTISAQFARDHYRSHHNEFTYGIQSQPMENLYRDKNWYWMAQIAWSM